MDKFFRILDSLTILFRVSHNCPGRRMSETLTESKSYHSLPRAAKTTLLVDHGYPGRNVRNLDRKITVTQGGMSGILTESCHSLPRAAKTTLLEDHSYPGRNVRNLDGEGMSGMLTECYHPLPRVAKTVTLPVDHSYPGRNVRNLDRVTVAQAGMPGMEEYTAVLTVPHCRTSISIAAAPVSSPFMPTGLFVCADPRYFLDGSLHITDVESSCDALVY
ncbi:hypothetical protein J6590_005174 [Homalodisca vitripennis]|nr:hypothetical protein J6590_005174 [Homalodisca vitripennis]